MHGRKKIKQSEIEAKIMLEKATAYSALVSKVMECIKNLDQAQETMVLTEKMLKINPDFYMLWNSRRTILLKDHGSTLGLREDIVDPSYKISAISELDPGHKIAQKELILSADGIRKNPKSYGAWYHRTWIINRFHVDLDFELELCSQLLKEDQRNFLCWNYRRNLIESFINGLLFPSKNDGIPSSAVDFVEDSLNAKVKQAILREFDFSTEKITENFSNYSAFHHRSVYLPLVLRYQLQNAGLVPVSSTNTDTLSSAFSTVTEALLRAEFRIVENAVFTEPDDQSAWWYLNFLIVWTERLCTQSAESKKGRMYLLALTTGFVDDQVGAPLLSKASFRQFLLQYIELMEQLGALEERNKWISLCLVNIYERLIVLETEPCQRASSTAALSEYESKRQELLSRLKELDPDHVRRYDYLMQRNLSIV